MGYDLHITRAKSRADNSRHCISSEEWLAYVEKDPELTLSLENGPYFAKWNGKSECPDPWLDWSDGDIYTKNPDATLIDKMVAIAHELHATVRGDDGETYVSGHKAPLYPQLSVFDRLRNWLQRRRPAPPIKRIDPPFKVGDRVLDIFHRETTVIEIDSEPNHGMGKVKVRYDDGREVSVALAASGLTVIPQKDKDE